MKLDERHPAEDNYVYHYTSFETARDYILQNGQIQLGNIKNTNDPREREELSFSYCGRGDTTYWLLCGSENDKIKAHDLVQIYSRQYIKLGCFTKDYFPLDNVSWPCRGWEHPRMWSQYANDHQGVCLIFSKQRLNESIKKGLIDISYFDSGDISYGDVLDLNNISLKLDGDDWNRSTDKEKFIGDLIWKNRKELYFFKHLDWQAEREYRWITLSEKKEPMLLDFEKSLIACICGYRMTKENIDLIQSMSCKYNATTAKLNWSKALPYKPVILKDHGVEWLKPKPSDKVGFDDELGVRIARW